MGKIKLYTKKAWWEVSYRTPNKWIDIRYKQKCVIKIDIYDKQEIISKKSGNLIFSDKKQNRFCISPKSLLSLVTNLLSILTSILNSYKQNVYLGTSVLK